MRESKFRAWANGYEKWCHSIEYIGDGLWLGYVDDGVGELSTTDIILEQYTGLKDKNDKEVYQGDIVRWKSSTGREITAPIVWNTRAWSWTAGDYMLSGIYELEVEVVGNIHQDMKLLTEGK
jgi:hypothetical protein